MASSRSASQQEILLRPMLPDRIKKSAGSQEPMNAAIQEAVEAVLQRWGREAALRCIALAYKELPRGQDAVTHADEHQLTFLGILGLHDPPRQEARPAIQACQDAGIRVIMLTGMSCFFHCNLVNEHLSIVVMCV